MFKNVLDFWRGKDFLSQVLDEFAHMMRDGRDMFSAVCRKLIDNEEVADLKETVYALDKKINGLERDIRKRIIEHLSVQPSVDVPACLLLMSVVKDAERLGDYGKNLFEVTELLEEPLNKEVYTRLFKELHEEILVLFDITQTAFAESDEAEARSAWERERVIVRRCDEVIEQLAASHLSVNEAVCLTLIARHFKRLTAHLSNIGTSVIVPVSDLDYFDEKKTEGYDV